MNESSTMKKGRCIKCRSNEVYKHDGRWGQGGSNMSNSIPIALFTNAVLINYVCKRCGYVESYVENEVKLKKMKEKWTKVSSLQLE